ncbi:hypothetical protein [Saccharopolyspora taberi]|uniref:Uncharacterized protein n=1 Tax=Saccharopolyspora taberi TaxID=60895 RepID=A0ABN3VJ48_9PSEU
MDYVVTAELEPPVDATELDALQREGVAALLDRQLALVEGVAGPAEAEIDVLDYRITVHPSGASVVLALDAPALLPAEQAAATVLNELIGESELLVGWSVAHSEVRITEDEFNESLAAAERIGAADDSGLEAAIEEALESAEESEATLDTEQWRSRLTELSGRLRAFDLDAFGTDSAETARLAAGALIHAVRVVTDEIFYDELALAINNATADDAVGLLVLEELPQCYEHRYDSWFARAFLLSSAAVASRLTDRDWTPPRTVAEALALRLFVNEAQVLLEAAELMTWDEGEPVFAAFARRAFADTGHEDLYLVDFMPLGDSEDQLSARLEAQFRERGLTFEQWFAPRESEAGMHPYLRPSSEEHPTEA